MTSRLTRRRFLAGGGVAAAVVGGLAGCGSGGRPLPHVVLGSQPGGLPPRQHAWDHYMGADEFGNGLAPRFDRLLFFDVEGVPTLAHARILEAALRRLERAYPWSHRGLLFVAGWGPSYFQRLLRVSSPVPRARALSSFELPEIDDYHLCLHLACDDETRLADVESSLLYGADRITDALRWRETRTGFVGAGLPAARQRVGGIPAGDPVPRSAPLFMGFKSGLLRNQATEDDITIPSGPLAGGTTMQVSYMRLRLESWYRDLDERARVARMYSPETTPAEVPRLHADAPSEPGQLANAIRRCGVIGHSQTSARARRHGRPIILRRDFNTVDGGQAGLHFVSVQRSIADFVTTRTAMNAASAPLANPAIGATVNNGINEFMFVLKRANYAVPNRADRSFPLLPGRRRALALV